MNNIWNKIKIILKGWVFSILVALLIATSIKSAVADWNDIPSGSMRPTIMIGDRVFVNKLAYDLKIPYTTIHLMKWSDPQRGDIVVFYSPADRKRLIKRVVGMPGDELSMHQNRLFINGKEIDYETQNESVSGSEKRILNEMLGDVSHSVMLAPSRSSMDSFGPIAIPEGKYFMMGDNRDNSSDSRVFGFVDRKAIVGRSSMVVISREGNFLHPRWNRFFKEIS